MFASVCEDMHFLKNFLDDCNLPEEVTQWGNGLYRSFMSYVTLEPIDNYIEYLRFYRDWWYNDVIIAGKVIEACERHFDEDSLCYVVAWCARNYQLHAAQEYVMKRQHLVMRCRFPEVRVIPPAVQDECEPPCKRSRSE